jgi:hypothetical protein
VPGLRWLAGELWDVQHTLALLALSAASALCSATSQAAAEPGEPGIAAPVPTRVVLIASPGMEELVLRFVAELDSLHLETVRLPAAETGPTVSELEQLAVDHDARVAVRVGKAGRAIDLWLVNPRSQELVHRRIVPEGGPAVQALRSLEILRGALVDLKAVDETPPPPPSPPVAPLPPKPEVPSAPPEPSTPAIWLGASGAIIAPHVGRSLGLAGLVALRRQLSAHFAVQAELLVPFSGWSVVGEGGRARVWLGSASCAALVAPWDDRRLSPALGLGVAVLGLRTKGEAQEGYEAASELNAAVFPHGRVELGIGLAHWLRLRAALVAGLATPRPILLFGDERAASWLNPLVISSLGVEVAVP